VEEVQLNHGFNFKFLMNAFMKYWNLFSDYKLNKIITNLNWIEDSGTNEKKSKWILNIAAYIFW